MSPPKDGKVLFRKIRGGGRARGAAVIDVGQVLQLSKRKLDKTIGEIHLKEIRKTIVENAKICNVATNLIDALPTRMFKFATMEKNFNIVTDLNSPMHCSFRFRKLVNQIVSNCIPRCYIRSDCIV